jgi:hypothetical protein
MPRTFGQAQLSEYEFQRQLIKMIDCDYKTWKLQWGANHEETESTMRRLIENLEKLLATYMVKQG